MTGLVYWQSVKQCIRVLYRYVKSDIITTIIPTVSTNLLTIFASLTFTMLLDFLRCRCRPTL